MRTFVQVGAIMIRFNAAARIVGVDMERIQMGTDLLYRAEVLGYSEGYVLTPVTSMEYSKAHECELTWPKAAPVSRTLLSVDSGLPMASLVIF